MRSVQRYFGWAAIPHLAVWIVALQACGYVCLHVPMRGLNPAEIADRMLLRPDRVLAGEWWRTLTFICLPPATNLLFLFLALWFFQLMGSYLEASWGTFRFNVYVGLWWLATVATSLATGWSPPANFYLHESVFLAFAFLLPDFEIRLMFLFPIPIKWLAWCIAISLVFDFFLFDGNGRLMILAGIANFLIFFYRDIWQFLQRRHRKNLWAARARSQPSPYRHQCRICGANDVTHPRTDFRYCSQCAGQACYCEAHLKQHEHVAADQPAGNS